jgi:predicted DCC family thiol-disulfide oxidoreductase YuxK
MRRLEYKLQAEQENRNDPQTGWVLYDGDCAFCRGLIARYGPMLARQGIVSEPLQSPWVRAKLGMSEEADLPLLLMEMRVLARDGQVYGGAEALVFLAGLFWWAWPLVVLSRLPGGLFLLSKGYRCIAERRHCASGHCSLK